MTTKAYFSKRIYKNRMENNHVEDVQHTLLTFNKAKHFRVQEEVREKRGIKLKPATSIHQRIKGKFGLNDYYANSAVQEGKALLSSQKELTQLYISNKKEQIKSMKKKLKKTKSRLTVLHKIKTSFIKGKPKFNKTSREQQKGNFFVVEYKHRTDVYYHSYDFEHLYLDKEIKKLKSRLGSLNFKIDRIQKQIHSLENGVKSVCFGSKKLAKARSTTQKYSTDKQQWEKDWYLARYGKMTISGRKDAGYGNFVFSYNTDQNSLSLKTIKGNVVQFNDVVFPYGQESIDFAINTQVNVKNKKKFGKPIGWSLEDHGEYYIIKCLIDVPPNPYVNHSRDIGVIGVDLNVNHFAVVNLNSNGQMTDSFCLKFDIQDKTSGQITKTIESEAIALVDYAVNNKKTIVLEKLDTTKSKVKNPYGNKVANRLMSQFAYNKMIISIKSRAEKLGVEIFEVNPAYTSQIGKMKYMKRLGISIHESAAYVIGRRAMGFKEKLPPVLHSLVPEKKQGLHHWAQWAYLTTNLSIIHKHAFYGIELSGLDRLNSWSSLFPQRSLTEFEVMSLSKLESRKSKA